MAHPHALEARSRQAERLNRVVGRKAGGAVTKKAVAAMIHKHEAHDHRGEAPTKLARGGNASGGKSPSRGDKKSRGGTHVNIILAHPDGDPRAGAAPMVRPVPVPVPMQRPGMPPMPPPGGMPVRPPMAGPPPGAVPGGPMRKGGKAHYAKGGKVSIPKPPKMKTGGGGGMGRLKKAGIKGVSR